MVFHTHLFQDPVLMFPMRVFNASVFYLRAIASPVNSAQFRAIQEQSRATEFQLETLVSIKRFSLFKLLTTIF